LSKSSADMVTELKTHVPFNSHLHSYNLQVVT